MRLMQKDFKGNHEHGPLRAARQRVKCSWKALKHSLHAKSKPQGSLNREGNSKHLDLSVKDEPDSTLDNLVDQNIKSFLADSDDYDGIAELFQKYQSERDAFNRLKNKLRGDDAASEFSDISSISELSLSSEADGGDDVQTVISAMSCFNLRQLKDVSQTCSKIRSHDTSSSSKASACSVKTELASDKDSPFCRKDVLTSTSSERLAPLEKARAVLKPLPSPMRPSYIPDISNFNDLDLSNIVLARAGSEASKRRGQNEEFCRDMDFNSNDVESFPETSANGNNDGTRCFSADCKSIGKDGSNYNLREDVYCNATSKHERHNVSHSEVKKSNFHAVPKNNCLPLMQLFNKKNDIKVSNAEEANINGELILNNDTSVRSKESPQYVTSGSSVIGINTLPRYRSDEYFTTHVGTGECQISSPAQSVGGETSNDAVMKPVNVSRSTMEKYPHIFASYLELQENAFNSLPNLTSRRANSLPLPNLSTNETISEHELLTPNDKTPCTDNIIIKNFKYSNVSIVDENYFIVYPDMSKAALICGNPPCSKQQIQGKHGQDKFTSCPSCFVSYCSRTCRHCHWPDHKEACIVGFVNFYVHTFFRRCEKDVYINEYLTNLAHGAYQVFGRGCVMIRFPSPTDIEYNAVSCGLNLSTQPVYKSFQNILSENKPRRHLHVLCQNIKDYDPDQEFVLSIFVWIGELNTTENMCTAVVRSARISMMGSQNVGVGDSILPYGIRTFSLPTSLCCGNSTENDIETRRYCCKEIAFGLKRYGVHLKSEYPEAYEKLYRYIDQAALFTPIILYGKRNGRNFKCILSSGKVEKSSSEYYGAGAFV